MEAATLRELIAKLKAEPDSMLFASSGTGPSDHLTAELFWQVTGISGVHVPYKGGGPAQTDLMGATPTPRSRTWAPSPISCATAR